MGVRRADRLRHWSNNYFPYQYLFVYSDMVNDKTKDIGPVLLTGLHHQFHSRMLSHYYSVWRLSAAVFRPWPVSPLLSQPGDNELPLCHHIDTELSADILST